MNNKVKGYIDGITRNILKENGLSLIKDANGRDGIGTEKGGYVAYLPVDHQPTVMTTATRTVRTADAFEPEAFAVLAKSLSPKLSDARALEMGKSYKEKLDKTADALCEQLGIVRDEFVRGMDISLKDWYTEAFPQDGFGEYLSSDVTFDILKMQFYMNRFEGIHANPEQVEARLSAAFLARAERFAGDDPSWAQAVNNLQAHMDTQNIDKMLGELNFQLSEDRYGQTTLSVYGGSVPKPITLPIDDGATLAERIVRAADAFDPFLYANELDKLAKCGKDQAMQLAEYIQSDLSVAADNIAKHYNISRNVNMMSLEAPIAYWLGDAFPELETPMIDPRITFADVNGKSADEIDKALNIEGDEGKIGLIIELSLITRNYHEPIERGDVHEDIKERHTAAVAGKGQARNKRDIEK